VPQPNIFYDLFRGNDEVPPPKIGSLTLRDAEKGTVLRTFVKDVARDDEANCALLPTAIAFVADGRRAVCGTAKGELLVWDMDGKKPKEALFGKGVATPIRAIAVSADGKWALTGSEGGLVRVWDLERGKNLHVLRRQSADE
jgi:WD40 repeat protein